MFSQQKTVTFTKKTDVETPFYEGRIHVGASLSVEVGKAYTFTFTECSSLAYIDELYVSIVDKSDLAPSNWLDVGGSLTYVATEMEPGEAKDRTTKILVTQTIDDPSQCDYYIVFQAYGVESNEENIDLLSYSKMTYGATSGAYWLDYPEFAYDLIVGQIAYYNWRIKYSNVEVQEGYPQWSSSDESVATVNQNGAVTAIAEGTTTISAMIKSTLLTDVVNSDTTYEAGTTLTNKIEKVVTVSPSFSVKKTNYTYCVGDEAFAPRVRASENATLNWYDSEMESLAAAPVPNTATVGFKTYYVSQTLGGVESEKDTITITVNDYPIYSKEIPEFAYAGAEISATVTTFKNNTFEWFVNGEAYGVDEGVTESKNTLSFENAGTQTVVLKLTENGCVTYDTTKITVKTMPTITFAQESYSIEKGEYIELTPTFAGFSGEISPVWKANAGKSVVDVTNGNVTGVAVGSDIVTVSVEYNDADLGKIKPSASVEIIVYAGETEEPTVSQTSYTYCVGAEATALSATASEGATLNWYDSEKASLAAAPVPSTEAAGTQTYFVSQTMDEVESEKVEITVTVNPTPEVSFVETPEYVLTNESFTMPVSTSVEGNYEWTVNGDVIATEAAPSFVFEVAATYNVDVTVTTEQGCIGTASTSVVVKEMPSAPVVGQTEFAYCVGADAAAFDVTASEGATLNWYNSESELLAEAPVASTAEAGTQTYFVSQSNDGLESEKVEISVVVNPIPSIAITKPATATVYKGVEFELFAESDVENLEYAWSSMNSVFSNEQSATSKVFSTGSFEYSVSVKSAAGCSNATSITITSIKEPSLSLNKTNSTIYEGEEITLNAVVENFGEVESASWISSNPEIATVENGVVAGVAAGNTTITYSMVYNDVVAGESAVIFASCDVEVRPAEAEEIICLTKSATMLVGESIIVKAELHSATETTYHIEMSAEDSAKVSIADKTITAVKAGEVTVYVVAGANEESKSDIRDAMTILIDENIPVKNVSMPKQITLKIGTDTTLQATVIPANASHPEVSFVEKEDDVVSVSANGFVYAKAAGTSVVTATTKEGLQAQTIVYVTESDKEIRSLQLPDTIRIMVGETMTIPCRISPTTIKANDLSWNVLDDDIATVTSNGVLEGKIIGASTLTVAYGTKTASVPVFVMSSLAPEISYISPVSIQQGTTAAIDLAKYVEDDNLFPEELTYKFSQNENIAVSLDGTVATFSVTNEEFIGNTEITVSAIETEIINAEEIQLVATRTISVQVIAKPNEAPVVLTEKIVIPYGKYTQVVVADMVSDDYTNVSDMEFEIVDEGENLKIRQFDGYFTVQAAPLSWYGFDEITVSFTDAEGLSTEKAIEVEVQAIEENKAPVIAEIPQQNENDNVNFSAIDLSQYVTDDYTAPSAIIWSASVSENVNVRIVGSIAEISDLNEYWRGAEVVTFTAMDQGGLTSSYDVTFYRDVTPSDEEKEFGWYGKPNVTIIASRYDGVPGDDFQLIGTFYGTECKGSWNIEGVELEDASSLEQSIVFDEVGTHQFTFTLEYDLEGKTMTSDINNELNVYGVVERDPAICIGNSVSMTAADGMETYEWSNGETGKSITVTPDVTTDYTLTMTKGLLTLVDVVTVKVSVPVQLPQDSVMCAGTTFELEAEGEYVSYQWNTEATSKAIVIPAEEKTYTVETLDEIGCTSSASFTVTKVNELPAIDLGENRTMCDKETLTLSAPEGMYSYKWENLVKNGTEVNSTESSIDLTKSAVVAVEIIDNNMCVNNDTVEVTFTYPYAEKIGVVTFSETSNNIIVAWERTAGVNTESYQVQRQLTGDNWESVGEAVAFNEDGIVIDDATNYLDRAYYYRLETTDGCGNKAYSGTYRSAFVMKEDGKITCWTYQSPIEGNVVNGYLLRQKVETINADAEMTDNYEILKEIDPTQDVVEWDDIEYTASDIIRVAFELSAPVNEKVVRDIAGNIVEGNDSKSESGPFAIAISNIAEAENEGPEAVADVFPADVVVYPSVVKDFVNVALAGNSVENYTIEIVDANGKVVVKTQTGDITKALIQIPAAGFGQGVYNVRIATDNAAKVVKIVK